MGIADGFPVGNTVGLCVLGATVGSGLGESVVGEPMGASVVGTALGVTELDPGDGFAVIGFRVGDGDAITCASQARRNKRNNFMFGILDSCNLSGEGGVN